MLKTKCFRDAMASMNPRDVDAIEQGVQARVQAGAATVATVRAAEIGAVNDVLAEIERERAEILRMVGEQYPGATADNQLDQSQSPPQTAQATHADPGEAPETATKAVVTEAVQKAAQNRGRKPSEMRAELLRMVDEAILEAPDYQAFLNDVQTYGEKDAREMYARGRRLGSEKFAPDGYSRPTRTFKVPGDGTFTVNNTVGQLMKFRRAVETSPGFADRPSRFVADREPTVERGSATPKTAVSNMIDDGDPQAAVDYAAARGLDIAEVLKGDKVRLPKVAGLTPTDAEAVGEFEPEADAEPAAPAQPAAAAERFAAGQALTKAERKQVLDSLVDVYKAKGAPREQKGIGRDGNERYGYVHSPELFEKSDITGAMVRYYVTLPDGRRAHPSELFPDYTQSDIDAEMAAREARKRDRQSDVQRATVPAQQFSTIREAVEWWDKRSRESTRTATGLPTIFPSEERRPLTNGSKFILVPNTTSGELLEAFAEAGWQVQRADQPAAASAATAEPWTLTREQAAKDYPGDEYDRMLNRHADLGDLPYVEADRRARINSLGQRKLWAKTRAQLEQEGKDAVKAARGDRAAINKLKSTPEFASWRLKSMSATGKQAIADAERLARDYLAIHKERVQEALMEGKDVPAEVLADYPDLQRPASAAPPAQQAEPAPVSSREGQMNLAYRGSRIAVLKQMNDRLRRIAPSEAWADKNIEDATDLDALQDQISAALVAAERGPAAVNPLRAELEAMSGAELRAIMERMNLAGARMVQEERIAALLAEDPAEVRAAMQQAEPATTDAQRKQAADHAKDLGGRVVWQRGELALIEGFSLLSGDSVYVAAKGDARTRVDIKSYTGSGYTDAERAELMQARAEAVRAADEALARNPDGPFSGGPLVFADDIPANVQGVVRGWIGLLGLDGARIVVTTPKSGAAMADGLAGKFRRIGKASLSGDNTNGTMQPLGGDDFHIAVRPNVSTLKTLEVLAHELGHIVERRAFAQAAPATQQAIREAHAKWLRENGGGRALDMAQAMRAYRSGQTTGFSDDARAAEAGAYWRSFGEWFADQVSRWATTQDRPVGVVEQFFKKLADRLRAFFTGERAKFKPDATMAQWLDSLAKDVPPADEVAAQQAAPSASAPTGLGTPVKRGMTVAQFDAWAKENAKRQPEQFAKRTEGVGLFAVTGENKGFKQVAGVVGSRTVADDTRDMRVVYRLDDGRLVWWRQEDGTAYEVAANDPRLTITMAPPQAERQQVERTVLAGTDDTGNVAMFSRAPATATKLNDVQQTVDTITATWASPPEVRVVWDLQDPAVDEEVRAEDARQRMNGATGTPKGFYYKGVVYIVASASSGSLDAAQTLFHEALGHAGLRAAFGAELKPILSLLAKTNRKAVEAKARAYGMDMNDEAQRLRAAEEVLAELAETRPTSTWVQKAIAAIRTWLRDNLPEIFGNMKMSDAEIIRNFIVPARDAIVRGREAQGRDAVPRFMRGDEGGGDDPMFSRSAADAIREVMPQAVQDRLTDAFTSQRGFNRWWHRTVGTQLHKAKIDKEFGRVYYAVQDFMKDVSRIATRAADQAPDLLPQIETLKDIAKKPAAKEDMKAASAALFDGTLRYKRNEEGEAVLAEDDELGGLVWTDQELRSRGVSKAGVKLYRQALAAINASLDSMLAADIYRMVSASDQRALAGNDMEADALLARVRKAAASDDPRSAVRMVSAALQDRIDLFDAQLDANDIGEQAETVKKLREKAAEALQTISDKVDRIDSLKKAGYAPLMRFGQYTVDVLNENGERVFFGMYESQMAANMAARKFREQGLTVTQGVQSKREFELLKGLSPETAKLFAELLGVEQNEAMQEWLKNAVAEQSALKRHIRRKGIEGFDDDSSRVVAAFLTSNARAASRALHSQRVQDAVASVTQGDVKDEAIALADYVNNPTEEAQAIRSLLFVQYIGGSVASAAVNLTQTFVQTFPFLAQYGGAGKAGKRIAAAMSAALVKINDNELNNAIRQAEKDGVIKPQEVFQLQAEASRTMGSNIYVRKGLAAWGALFQLAEQYNRRVAFIAAYQTAKEEGIADPFAFAENAVDETQSVFNKGNRPNWSRGAVGATLFTFKTFTIQYLEFLSRLPMEQRLLALAVLVLLSGAKGLPFGEDAEDIVDTIAQQMGYNWTTKDNLNRWLVSQLGQGWADFIQHGVSGISGVPLDVSQRLGMADLLPGTGVLKPSETRKEDQVLEVFGVAGSFVRDTLKTAPKLASGDVRGALEAGGPVAFRNVAKALDMYDMGMYRDTRGRKITDTDAVDAALKGLGFQPSSVAREQRAVGREYEKAALYRKVKNDITERMALGRFENDPGKIAEAREARDRWNEQNPDAKITIDMPSVIRRVKEMRKSRTERFISSAPKDIRQQTAEALR